MRGHWTFASANELIFGCGSVAQLGRLVARRGVHHLLIITDPQLVAAGIVERVEQPLLAAGITVAIFDQGRPEPTIAAAMAAEHCAREFRPDAILGLGGGSNLDLAKFAAVLYRHGGQAPDYFGFDRIPGPITPLVCVPTTAGTGSEVSHAAVLTDEANSIKVSTLSPHLRPALAVVDPELTYSCPAKATADSGIDALTHAIEAYTAIDFSALEAPSDEPVAYTGREPLSDCLAEKAISLIGRHLRTAVHDPQNKESRDAMALAATLAGLAFSNAGVAVVHALEYPLGGAVHVSHGAGNGLLLPHVMRFNLPARTAELARVAELLGADVRGLSPPETAERGIEFIENLKREIGIPTRIRDLGAARDQLSLFAERAYAIKRLMHTNPRLPTQADLLSIYESAF